MILTLILLFDAVLLVYAFKVLKTESKLRNDIKFPKQFHSVNLGKYDLKKLAS